MFLTLSLSLNFIEIAFIQFNSNPVHFISHFPTCFIPTYLNMNFRDQVTLDAFQKTPSMRSNPSRTTPPIFLE